MMKSILGFFEKLGEASIAMTKPGKEHSPEPIDPEEEARHLRRLELADKILGASDFFADLKASHSPSRTRGPTIVGRPTPIPGTRIIIMRR